MLSQDLHLAFRVAEHAPTLLAYVDVGLRVLYANRRCRELAGRGDLVGAALPSILDEPTLRRARVHAAELERGVVHAREYVLRDRTGTKQVVHLRASVDRDALGRTIGYFVSATAPAPALNETLGSVMCEVGPFAASLGVRLEPVAEGHVVPKAAEAPGLRRALARLVGLCVERSCRGGCVRVRVQAQGSSAVFAVEDEASEPIAPGNLSVAIARAEIERLGGTLEVRQTGRGAACLRVELPREPAAEAAR